MSVSADKDFSLEELYQELLERQWIIPFPDGGTIASDAKDNELIESKTEWLIKHICNIEIVDVFRGGNTRKSFQKTNNPCDGLHAMNYARLALVTRGHILNRPGHSSQGVINPVLAHFGRRGGRFF